MTEEEYAAMLAAKFNQGDWAGLKAELLGINMPDGWEQMVQSFFEGYFHKTFVPEVISIDDIAESEKHSLDMAPAEIRERINNAIKLSYQSEDESGHIALPVIPEGDKFKVILVGGG